jgi:hypothetical protein
MKVMKAQAGALRERLKSRRALRLVDGAADLRHERRVTLLDRRLIRLAPTAGPESGALGLGRGPMEAHVLRVGQSRRTRRPAIDAGRLHRVEKGAVGLPIA